MCERAYTACPECKDRVEDCMVWEVVVRRRFDRSYPVDSDGDPEYDTYDDGEDLDDESEDGSLYCRNCGNYPSREDLLTDYVDEDCDCEECEPPPPNDPDELVTIVRRKGAASAKLVNHDLYLRDEDCPPEIELLLTRRSINRLPVRYERACEIELWAEGIVGGMNVPFVVNHEDPVPAHVKSLAVPEPGSVDLTDPRQLAMIEHNSLEVAAELEGA